jgi:zinc transporter ZupT
MFEITALFLAAFAPGAILVMVNRTMKGLKYLLAFSGAYLVAMIFSHLAPGVYVHGGFSAGYWILAGFLIQIVLEFMSHGAEHGHLHHHGRGFPVGVLIGLVLHAFFEGLPFHHGFHDHHGHAHHHHDHGTHLLAGIVIHQIPISIALGSMLLAAGFSKAKALLPLGAFGLAAPAGAVFAGLLSEGFLTQYSFIFDSLVIGVLLHVATTILFETDSSHKVNLLKIIIIVSGMALGVVRF